MKNLLDETLLAIKESGHNIDDIDTISSSDGEFSCSWDEYMVMSNKDYDNSCGTSTYVCQDIIFVFKDGSTMWRMEDTGEEWWEFSRPFNKKSETKKIKELFCISGKLNDVN